MIIIKSNQKFFLYVYLERAIAAKIQTTGVSVRIKRTIIPAKYDANIAYKTTNRLIIS